MKVLGWIIIALGGLIMIATDPMMGAGVALTILGMVLLSRI
jgi:hypothetical protein